MNGLYYYGARWYDNQLGRFISPDTIIPGAGNPQAWDRYAYGLNNPSRYKDPSGHSPCDLGKYADPECNDPKVRITSTSNERRARQKELAKQPLMPIPLHLYQNPPMSPSLTIGVSHGPYPNPYLSSLTELIPILKYYKIGEEILEVIEYVDNFGKPIYRQWKGSLPGGSVIEGVLGATTQLAEDLNDQSRIRTGIDLFGRASLAGFEDGVTESLSSPVGAAVGSAGAICGPLAPICIGGGYLIGANATTWVMDNWIWQPINIEVKFYR